MKNKSIIKWIIIAVAMVIVLIIAGIVAIKIDSSKSKIENTIETSNNTETNSVEDENVPAQDISEVWHEINSIDEYRLWGSLETYSQKYFQKKSPVNNFANFNIDDVWCFYKTEGEKEIDEYYIKGYACNTDFSEIKNIAVKFSVRDDDAFKIEQLNNVDFTNVTWDNFINSKQAEIQSNWAKIQENNEKVKASDKSDEENITEEKEQIIDEENGTEDLSVENEAALKAEANSDEEDGEEEKPAQYNENTFGILEIDDKYMINRYFINYKIKVLTDKTKAYEILSEETKSGLFTSAQDFENKIGIYINNNTAISKVKINTPILDNNDNTNSLVQYMVADNNSKIYTFDITELNNYKVTFNN